VISFQVYLYTTFALSCRLGEKWDFPAKIVVDKELLVFYAKET